MPTVNGVEVAKTKSPFVERILVMEKKEILEKQMIYKDKTYHLSKVRKCN